MKYNLVARWPETDLYYRDKQCPKCKKEYLDTDKIFCDTCECTKEETIEEAANYYLNNKFPEGFKYRDMPITRFINVCYDLVKLGTTWQKEQDSKVMYTEEEVNFLTEMAYDLGRVDRGKSIAFGKYVNEFNNWFKTNKKK